MSHSLGPLVLDHARAHPCGLGNVLHVNRATEPKRPACCQSCRRGAVDARTWSRHAHGISSSGTGDLNACHVRGRCHQAVFIAGHDAVGVRRRSHYSAANSSGASRGTTMRIFVPAPGLVSRLIRPPRRLVTMLWTMCNPRPVLPWSRRVVKNGSNTWRLTSGLMPQPSSENSTSTLSLPDAPAVIWTDPRAPSGNA